MIKIENIEVTGFEQAIRGMRNPMNSWDKGDSGICGGNSHMGCLNCSTGEDSCDRPFDGSFHIGKKDHELMTNLAMAGSVHAKYRRMIIIYMDITAPLYWWKEFDTYKVGTVANSCSTMHKIAEKEFTVDDFSYEHLIKINKAQLLNTITTLNDFREYYNKWDNPKNYRDKDNKCLLRSSGINCKKDIWWQLIQLLPSSYNQRRTVMLNYENASAMYFYRHDHKQDEWRDFCKVLETLPYSELIYYKW